MTVDLSPLIQAGVGLAALALGVFGSWALQRIAQRVGIQISVDRRNQMEDAITKAAQAGAVAVEGMAAAQGWSHPQVKSAMVGEAMTYMVSRFNDTMKQCGLDPNNPADAERIRGAIERVLPTAAAPIAASPVTTDGPDKPPATGIIAVGEAGPELRP